MAKTKAKTSVLTLDSLIRFYSKIPTERFCKGQFSDGKGRHCAVGFLQYRGKETTKSYAVRKLAPKIVAANDNYKSARFKPKGSSAKLRVLNYLKSLLK